MGIGSGRTVELGLPQSFPVGSHEYREWKDRNKGIDGNELCARPEGDVMMLSLSLCSQLSFQGFRTLCPTLVRNWMKEREKSSTGRSVVLAGMVDLIIC